MVENPEFQACFSGLVPSGSDAGGENKKNHKNNKNNNYWKWATPHHHLQRSDNPFRQPQTLTKLPQREGGSNHFRRPIPIRKSKSKE